MDDPARRVLILKLQVDKLHKAGDPRGDLAGVQQNIGEALMKLNEPAEAATYFEPALQFYRAKGQQMPADLGTQV